MNIEELYQKYWEDTKRHKEEWEAFALTPEAKKNGYASYTGFKVDYGYFETEIIKSLKEEFSLTDNQVSYIYGEAYERYHASFGDVFYGSRDLASFVTKFPKN